MMDEMTIAAQRLAPVPEEHSDAFWPMDYAPQRAKPNSGFGRTITEQQLKRDGINHSARRHILREHVNPFFGSVYEPLHNDGGVDKRLLEKLIALV